MIYKDGNMESIDFTVAVIHAKIALRTMTPSIVADYVAHSFPSLTPDDVENVMESARKLMILSRPETKEKQ